MVVKKFDWANYIYRCILGAYYVKYNSNRED